MNQAHLIVLEFAPLNSKMTHIIKIIQHNIKSLRSKKDQLDHYLHINKIDIAILSEIWIKNEEHLKIPNYSIQKFCRSQGYGGVAIVINENIKFTKKKKKIFFIL